MSQHIYYRANLLVILGYDRPLDYVFCTIERDGQRIYSNLWDDNAGTEQKDVNYFRTVLAKFNIVLPEEIYTEVENDKRYKFGFRVVHWT